jgi:hypothetical protein
MSSSQKVGKTDNKSIVSEKQASIPIEPVALTTPFVPPQLQTQLSNFMKNFYTPFIYKDYHINIGGPDGDHIQASMIYEDALPQQNVYTSYKSLKERNNLTLHIRSTFIQKEEGEIITFGGRENSILSRLKLISLNPYDSNRFSSNPYDSLPKDMFIYNSCYPIIFDRSGATTQCKKDSSSINMRVYRLKIEEAILINQIIKKPIIFDNMEYDFKNKQLLRDIINVLQDDDLDKEKKKLSISNYLDKELESRDDPDKIQFLNKFDYASKSIEEQKKQIFSFFNNKINMKLKELSFKEFNIWREIYYYKFIREEMCKNLVSPNFVQSYCYFVDNNSKINFNRNGKIDLMSNLTELYSKKVLVLLTESPNYSFFDWCSDIYEKEYNINKQIYRGFKTDEEWFSIIAQMLISFYIMCHYGFIITDMELRYNFYIKEVGIPKDSSQYWRYIINGIEYYIPCHGSLLLIDSNYRDLDPKENKFKIYSLDFEEDKEEKEKLNKQITKMVIENALKCINFNNFTQDFKNSGGVTPSEKVKKYLDIINKDIENLSKSSNLSNFNKNLFMNEFNIVLRTNLKNFVHNRIGTPLRESEVRYISKGDVRPFKKGELILYESKWQTYEIVLFMELLDDAECYIITKDLQNNELFVKKSPLDILYHYSNTEIIKQDTKPGEPSLNLDYIIESYQI